MDTHWILNKDGSIYHLNLHREELAETIITVGDPDRVHQISALFDSIETQKQCREFRTVTGVINSKRISIVSTGIGVDNIDIVINEIDYLFNWDVANQCRKEQTTTLNFVRLGTSGAIQHEIAVDSILISSNAIHRSCFLSHYPCPEIRILEFNKFLNHLPEVPVFQVACDHQLMNHFQSHEFLEGTTMTCDGFYGPQGRVNGIGTHNYLNDWSTYRSPEFGKITNLEMETAGIYGLSKFFRHRALSINAILANRVTQQFSVHPEKTIQKMIELSLEKILSFS
ncbi:MAG: nucleoside phosphorylase [Saprospiraceae bacterium]|nr:nucleoside phosphorylase [Saprospiraceae bacterium]